MKDKARFAALVAAVLLVAPLAAADTIVFSGELSDNDEPDISVFAATVNYSFDSGTNILTVEVINDTSAPKEYTLSELFFNVSDDVTGLSIFDDGGFTTAALTTSENAGGFGTFDYLFDFVVPGNNGLAAGDSVTLEFLATGAGLTTADFFSGFQTGGGADKGDAVAAIKFTQGPEDDSVYAIPGEGPGPGPIIPEPGTMALLAIGVAGLAARKLRKA